MHFWAGVLRDGFWSACLSFAFPTWLALSQIATILSAWSQREGNVGAEPQLSPMAVWCEWERNFSFFDGFEGSESLGLHATTVLNSVYTDLRSLSTPSFLNRLGRVIFSKLEISSCDLSHFTNKMSKCSNDWRGAAWCDTSLPPELCEHSISYSPFCHWASSRQAFLLLLEWAPASGILHQLSLLPFGSLPHLLPVLPRYYFLNESPLTILFNIATC